MSNESQPSGTPPTVRRSLQTEPLPMRDQERNGQAVNGKRSARNGNAHNGAVHNGVAHNGLALNGAAAAHGIATRISGDLLRRLDVAFDWNEALPERADSWSWRAGQSVKRGLDLVLASVLLLGLLPLFAVVSALIKLTSPGPVFYTCDFVGYRGRRFPGYKFRTMVEDAEGKKDALLHLNHMKGPAFKIKDDPRITRWGGFLRRYSIDELPQLWNVVRGDMSLVGPRPPLPEEWAEYEPWHRAKLAVIPGITCYWQISGRSDITDFDDWARLDLRYIEDWTLWTDFKILLRTVPVVVKGHGAY